MKQFGIFAFAIVASSVIAAQDAVPPTRKTPTFLKGVELDLPSQEAFRGWPEPFLVERLYPLPWTDATFLRSRLLEQPLVLVLAEPWSEPSRKMFRESFRDPRVLRELNGQFLTVIASADRRPELMLRYQTASWPVVALLLPDGNPMLSQANATGYALPITLGYAPPEATVFALSQGRLYFDKWGGMLAGLAKIYEERTSQLPPQAGAPRLEASDQMARFLAGSADAALGGYGAAPKSAHASLFEYAALREDRGRAETVAHARFSLERLVASPLWDAGEGGIRRAALAPEWKDVQSEKLLEGNAELLRDLVFALRRKEDPSLEEAAKGVARFLTTRLPRPEGSGFRIASFPSEDGGAPTVDPLVLSGPNALAGAALLRAGGLLEDPALERAGRAAVELVLDRSFAPGRGVEHVIEPDPDRFRFLVAQAEVAFGLVDAYEATGEARYLDDAKDVVDFVERNLRKGDEIAFRDFLPTAAPAGLLTSPRWPMRENVLLARTMLRLAAHGKGEGYGARAREIVGAFGSDPTSFQAQGILAAVAIEEAAGTPLTVTIDGDPSQGPVAKLRRAALDLPRAWTVVGTGSRRGPASATLRLGEEERVARTPDELRKAAGELGGAP